MKTVRNIFMALMLVASFVACRDKAAEKRIAELESRLKTLESGNNPTSSSATPVPAVQPAAEEKPAGPLPTLEFEAMEQDLGTVSEGQKVPIMYKFKNTGSAPLIIQNAQPSCGCTDPDWTRDPVPVGGTGFVKAAFDTKGKAGPNTKTITVTANTWPKQVTLKFKANVTAAANNAGPVK